LLLLLLSSMLKQKRNTMLQRWLAAAAAVLFLGTGGHCSGHGSGLGGASAASAASDSSASMEGQQQSHYSDSGAHSDSQPRPQLQPHLQPNLHLHLHRPHRQHLQHLHRHNDPDVFEVLVSPTCPNSPSASQFFARENQTCYAHGELLDPDPSLYSYDPPFESSFAAFDYEVAQEQPSLSSLYPLADHRPPPHRQSRHREGQPPSGSSIAHSCSANSIPSASSFGYSPTGNVPQLQDYPSQGEESPEPEARSMARVYADVNAQMPRSYWDYDSVNISWGALENYEVVRKIGTSSA
jgi:hypothetical protein